MHLFVVLYVFVFLCLIKYEGQEIEMSIFSANILTNNT